MPGRFGKRPARRMRWKVGNAVRECGPRLQARARKLGYIDESPVEMTAEVWARMVKAFSSDMRRFRAPRSDYDNAT